jgi:hypothetical protein
VLACSRCSAQYQPWISAITGFGARHTLIAVCGGEVGGRLEEHEVVAGVRCPWVVTRSATHDNVSLKSAPAQKARPAARRTMPFDVLVPHRGVDGGKGLRVHASLSAIDPHTPDRTNPDSAVAA